jgi:D-alanyl-D-alanine carboxypeptidase
MVLPAAIGFFITSMIASLLSPFTGGQPAIASGTPSGGRVLGAVEQTYNVPEQTYAPFFPEHNLPKNQSLVVTPEKNATASDLDVAASSSAAIDRDSGNVLWDQDSDTVRPIASITKLMTAFVFLSADPDMDATYQLQKEDVRTGGKSYIYPGDQVKNRDLFYLTLVGSDNTAAMALARTLGLSEDEFVARMNQQAKDFSLTKTKFQDISGLSNGNVSTAKEVLILAKKCLAKPEIRDTSIQENYEFSTVGGRDVKIASTDQLLSVFPVDGINIIGGKTGHTDEAGYCFVGEFANQDGHKILSVVMGTNSDAERFTQSKKLAKWIYNNYLWQ